MLGSKSERLPIRHAHGASAWRVRPDGIVHLERRIDTRVEVEEIDAFGGFWSIAIADVPRGQIELQVGRKICKIAGKVALFIPPFAVLRWRISPGRLVFAAYNDDRSFLDASSGENLLLKSIATIPESPTRQVLAQLLGEPGELTTLPIRSGHIVIDKAKRMIDESYRTGRSIADIAASLHVSHAVLTRYFKDFYGIPPIGYRNRLRIFESHFRLTKATPTIASVGMDVGFESTRQFNREFKKIVSAAPSAFHFQER